MTLASALGDASAPNWVIDENPARDRPQAETFEITVFGRGIGECVAIHLGHGAWCLIDSMRNPTTGQPAGIEYLEQIGVDPSRNVKVIVGTHLHMDHVAALAECVRRCKDALVVLPQALYPKEVLTVLKLPTEKLRRLEELRQVKAAVDSKGSRSPLRFAKAGTRLLPQPLARHLANQLSMRTPPVFDSLSPSDAATERVAHQMRLILEDQTGDRRLPRELHNEVSVVLVVNVGHATVLLGADLERSSRPAESWDAVAAEWPAHVGPAATLKVPHHGSNNADTPDLWGLLAPKPLGVLAPYRGGSVPVPRPGDLVRLLQKCGAVFATSRDKPPVPGPTVRAEYLALLESGYNPMITSFGAVRLRRSILDADGYWQVAFSGSAGLIG